MSTQAPVWDEATKTCRLKANVHYQIMYAQMGYEQNLQNYVLKMVKSAADTEWTFNRL